MRCLSLASVLSEQGDLVGFCARDLNAGYQPLIAQCAQFYWPLSSPDDALATCQVAREFEADWVVVDHYELGWDWEAQVKATSVRLMALDDLPGRMHQVDLLLDQNWLESAHAYSRSAPGATYLLGPRYALLRRQFREVQPPTRTGEVRRVLVSFGGSDPSNQTEKALRALQSENLERIEVVVGRACAHRHRLEQLCRDQPRVGFHVQLESMAQMMASVDFCIGSPGSTTWERCRLGLPGLVIVQAENQLAVAECAEKLGVQRSLGWDATVSSDALRHAFRHLCQFPQELQAMSRKGMSVVDGLGAERVALRLRQWNGK